MLHVRLRAAIVELFKLATLHLLFKIQNNRANCCKIALTWHAVCSIGAEQGGAAFCKGMHISAYLAENVHATAEAENVIQCKILDHKLIS